MAEDSCTEAGPAVTYDYIPAHYGSKRGADQETPKAERVPGIIYDERSTYRQSFTEIPPPHSKDLPWRPNAHVAGDRPVRGTLPGYFGPEYTNPYSKIQTLPHPTYESSGAERMRADVAEEVSRQREHDKVIPVPKITMPDEPVEKFSEYRSGYCKTVNKDDETIPDVKPMSNGLYKYYQAADNFSYNSQHSSKNY